MCSVLVVRVIRGLRRVKILVSMFALWKFLRTANGLMVTRTLVPVHGLGSNRRFCGLECREVNRVRVKLVEGRTRTDRGSVVVRTPARTGARMLIRLLLWVIEGLPGRALNYSLVRGLLAGVAYCVSLLIRF